jgi:hypothetical protein
MIIYPLLLFVKGNVEKKQRKNGFFSREKPLKGLR